MLINETLNALDSKLIVGGILSPPTKYPSHSSHSQVDRQRDRQRVTQIDRQIDRQIERERKRERERESVSTALLPLSLRDPCKRAPHQIPQRGPYRERCPLLEPSFTYHPESPINSLLIQQNLTFLSKSLVKESPLRGPPTDPLWRVMVCFSPVESDGPFPKPVVIHSFVCISKSPRLRSSPMKQEKRVWSRYTELHTDKSFAYNGVWPGSPRGFFMTLLLLPHFHAIFSTIPSTLTWIDQTYIFLVFLPISYFCITLTSYTFYAFSFFFFFYSRVALLGIRLHQPDRECFPVLHQPSCLLQVLSFFLISFHICSSHSILGLSLPLFPLSLVSHICLGFLLSSTLIRCPNHLSSSCQTLQ